MRQPSMDGDAHADPTTSPEKKGRRQNHWPKYFEINGILPPGRRWAQRGLSRFGVSPGDKEPPAINGCVFSRHGHFTSVMCKK
jgi:hypothetical protein